MDERWIEVDGIRTRYLEAGSGGATILLLHAGALGGEGVCHNAFAWETVIPGLAADARVIALDMLAHGRTAVPSRDEDLAYPALVRHAQAFMAALGLTDVHAVGHDEGGLVAMRLGLKGRLRSCTVVSVRSVAPAGDQGLNFTLAGPLEPRFSRRAQAWALERQSRNTVHITVGRFLDEAEAAGRTGLPARLTSDLQERVVAPSLSRLRVDNWARFRAGYPVPMLLVWGSDDPMSGIPHARALFELVRPGQRVLHLRLIAHAGYLPMREQPAAFTQAVGGFVRALAASAREGGSRHDPT